MMATATVKKTETKKEKKRLISHKKTSAKITSPDAYNQHNVHRKHGYSSCFKCGYRAVHLHDGECPACLQCEGCRKEVHSCICIEGE